METTQDVIALVVQAVGGASASFAAENNKDASKGGHIMLGGIVFQLGETMTLNQMASMSSIWLTNPCEQPRSLCILRLLQNF